MEGNFETSGGGFANGGSMPDPGGSIEFESGGSLNDSSGISSSNSDFTHLDYLKDGIDKGYYKQDTEGIFSMEEVMGEAQAEIERDEVEEWNIMDIPGTAHQKLEAFADGEDKAEVSEVEEVEEEKLGSEESVKGQIDTDKSVESKNNEPTFEQQIIKLQAETMKLMAEGMNSNVDKKELEELLKKIRELMKNTEKDDSNIKASLLAGLFSSFLILMQATEKGYKMLEREVKESEK